MDEVKLDEIKDRLLRCFETVFPQVSPDLFSGASQESLAQWDSIAAITLVNVIEDEFGFPVDLDLLPELNSFNRVLHYVRNQAQG
jgi:acyl carrier protein